MEWGTGQAILQISSYFCTKSSGILEQLLSLNLVTLPVVKRKERPPELAEDATSRLTGKNLPGGLSGPPPCLQKGKLRPKGSAWVRSQSWSTPAQPGPWSGRTVHEVGWFAHIPTNADCTPGRQLHTRAPLHPSCCQPNAHLGGHTKDKGGQT